MLNSCCHFISVGSFLHIISTLYSHVCGAQIIIWMGCFIERYLNKKSLQKWKCGFSSSYSSGPRHRWPLCQCRWSLWWYFVTSKMRNQGDPRHRHGFRCRWCRSPLCSACAAGWGNLFLEVEQMSKIDFENEIIGMEMMAALIVVEGSWRGWADRCGP